jgi:hypothetical protein
MPVETGRVIKRKRVKLPSGGSVDVPVITQITFLDVVSQGQESEFHLENSGSAKRDVHVASLPGGGAGSDESGGGDDSTLKVERIDVWRVLDVVEHGQETFFHPDSKTVRQPPAAPPYFATHEKTHVVKYVNSPDDGNWIKSELIDQWKYADTVEQGQETEYFLSNPPDNTGIAGLTLGTDSDGKPTVAVDPSLPDITSSGSGVDPAWRLDPFQNIVDFSGGGVWFTSVTIGGGGYSWDATWQCPGCDNQGGTDAPLPPPGANSGSDTHQVTIFYRSTDGTNWDPIDESEVFADDHETAITVNNGYFIATGFKFFMVAPQVTVTCRNETTGQEFTYSCHAEGNVPYASAVGMHSADQGKTWQTISDTQVSPSSNVAYDAGNNAFTVTFYDAATGAPIAYGIPVPWDAKKYKAAVTTGNIGTGSVWVRYGDADSTTASLETSTDGGNTWNVTLRVGSSPGFNFGFSNLLFQPL